MINLKKAFDLDAKHEINSKAKDFFKTLKNKGNNDKYKIGEIVYFYTGADKNWFVKAAIKHVNNDDIYVYNDCYWFPINQSEILHVELSN